jgi:pimeloyl-ACP methyl ester carboxylesterase
MLGRRSFLIASAAALAGCGQDWNGFRYFTAGNPKASPLVVAPVGPGGLDDFLPQSTIEAFVSAGFYVVGAHWRGLDGGDEDYGARHSLIGAWMQDLGIRRPAAFAQSRGALQLLNFACDHPTAFSCIAALFPVTDPLVFPGPTRKLWAAHGLSQPRPLDGFTPNARAHRLRGRPIRIWHGDRDETVPKERTSDVFAAASGAQLVTVRGTGHRIVDYSPIVDYLAHASTPAAFRSAMSVPSTSASSSVVVAFAS